MRISDWSSDVCSSDLRFQPCLAPDLTPVGRLIRDGQAQGDVGLMRVAGSAEHVSQIDAPGLRPPSCGGLAPTAYRSSSTGDRSEERRVGKEWVSTCRTWGSP